MTTLKVSSGHDRDGIPMNFLQLWLPVEDHSSQHSSTDGGGVHKAPLLVEELRVADGCRGREVIFRDEPTAWLYIFHWSTLYPCVYMGNTNGFRRKHEFEREMWEGT